MMLLQHLKVNNMIENCLIFQLPNWLDNTFENERMPAPENQKDHTHTHTQLMSNNFEVSSKRQQGDGKWKRGQIWPS